MAQKKTKKKGSAASKKNASPSDEIAPSRRMKLEDGVTREFDMPPQMADEISSSFSFEELAKKLNGKAGDEKRKIYQEFGQSVMKKVIEVADTKYMDRTGEMINLVASQTGVNFPHRIGRYVELSVLSLRPQDKWNITLSTTSEMRLQEYSCTMHKSLSEAGVNMEDLPCGASCIGGFIEAATQTSIKMRIVHSAKLPEADYCEFTFTRL